MTDHALYVTLFLTLIGGGLIGFIVGIEKEAARWRESLRAEEEARKSERAWN